MASRLASISQTEVNPAMSKNNVRQFDSPVLLVGGGEIEWELLKQQRVAGYPIVGVDGGANRLKENGIVPDLLIGDLDSVADRDSYSKQTEIIEISEQDTTDFEKSLYSIDAPLFIAFGFWGGRLDHSLAALHVLTKYRSQKSILLVDQIDMMLVPGGNFSMALPKNSRISIYPLEPTTFQASQGLKYPLTGLTLKAGDAVGVSNETTSEEVEITPSPDSSDNYAVIIPNRFLSSLIQQR